MHQGDRPDSPTTSVLGTNDVQRTCYRCGKSEEAQRPLRLLPGSTNIIVCPACYQFLWGERPVRLKPPKNGERRH